MMNNKRSNTPILLQAAIHTLILLLFYCSSCTQKTKESEKVLPNKKTTKLTNEVKILRLLVWEGYAPEKYVKQFEKEILAKYGKEVKVQVRYAHGSDDFFNAARDHSADMLTISHHLFKDKKLDYIKKGLIIAPDTKNIPNLKYLIPQLMKSDYHTNGKKLFGIPIANGPYGLVYNTAIFKTAPKSWNIFWDPAHKEKYILGAEEYLYNTNITALAMGYPLKLSSNFETLNNAKFKKKLRELAVNASYHWKGVDKPDDYTGMNLAMSWGDALTELKKRGKIWKMADPKEGTLWWIDDYVLTSSLLKKPFLKKVAEKWINTTISTSFQLDHIVRTVGIYPVSTNIKDKLTALEKQKIQPEDFNTFMDKRILQQTYSQRDRNGLKLLWQEAMHGIKTKSKKK